MTKTTTCPKCHATYRVTELHWCRHVEPRPSSSAVTLVSLAVWALAVACVVGWAVWWCAIRN